MKKLFLFSFLFILMISLVAAQEATRCTIPGNPPGTNVCWERFYTHTNGVTAHAKISYTVTDLVGGKPLDTGKAIGELFVTRIMVLEEDFVWYRNLASWDDIDVNFRGFRNGMFTQISNRKLILATEGETWTDCFVFAAYDCSGGNCLEGDNAAEAWAWTSIAAGYLGSGNCFNIDVVECTENSHCSGIQVCSQNSCITQICQEADTRCVGDDYQICQNNDWQNQGGTVGQCGIECISNSDCPINFICSSNQCTTQQRADYYWFADNECTLVSLLPGEVTDNHFPTLKQCEDNIKGFDFTIIGIILIGGLIVFSVSNFSLFGKRRR